MIILGIDPGLDGALALSINTETLIVRDMPTLTRRMSNGKTRRELDLRTLASWFEEYVPEDEPIHAFCEAPSAMPKQGVTSSFRFGYGCGAVHAMLAAFRIPYTLVAPGTWKRTMGLNADKENARMRAGQLFPQHAHNWPLKKHDGRAEAALLTYYGRLQQHGR